MVPAPCSIVAGVSGTGSGAGGLSMSGTVPYRRWRRLPAPASDVIQNNQKNRFEVCFQQGHYLTKLSIEDTPEYAAHGTYYMTSTRAFCVAD